ncbi:patatin-like phospholipase family protein [Streptomyces sp. NPDC057950]|uniref:patatin-like phospholipase family protein n=1 Tax=Streptomyces sp. NPDC057950 TaxID=3346288 RepID=UPI0036E57B50
MSTALVLGGGGVTGIARELGVLEALRQAGADLAAADLVVGTSAGSVVAVQATSGIGLHRLVADQLLGHDVVVVLAPGIGPGLDPVSEGLSAEVPPLRTHSRVLVVTPDDDALEAIGPDPLDPEHRPASARAGQRQGRAPAGARREIWPAPATR